MAAHANATAPASHADHEHAHPTPGTYAKIGVVLFVLTALEVGLYEATYGNHAGAGAQSLVPFFVPVLLLLSAAKFALVAMFYMHLKNDSKLFSSVFVFPIIIAAIVIVSLVILMAYHLAFARAG
jgi:cytochrome c oxidase subunit IV